MIKIKNFEEEETYIQDEDGYWGVQLSEDSLIYLTTEETEPKTGEIKIPLLPFKKTYKTSGFMITPYIPEIFKSLEKLSNEIDFLKRENQDIKQKINQFYSEPETIQIKELSDKKIEKIILTYLKENKDQEFFPSDIAFEFNLDAKKVFDICQKLKEEGKIL